MPDESGYAEADREEKPMTNVQQPEMRRSEESPTTKQRTQDADPTQAPGGSHDKTSNQPTPEGQASPYGPSGKTSSDGS
jgi:hypothetical protein